MELAHARIYRLKVGQAPAPSGGANPVGYQPQQMMSEVRPDLQGLWILVCIDQASAQQG